MGASLCGRYFHIAILFLFLSAFFVSCSNTKHLAEDETLYTYTWFSERGLAKVKLKPLKAYELYLVGNVKTNRPFVLLPRTNLTIYNYFKPSGNWGPRHYIKRVFGKPPVLLKDVNPEFRLKVMKQRLAEMGHFDSDIELNLKYYGKNDKKVRAKYKVFFKSAYTYRTLEFIKKQTSIDSIIAASMTKSIIEPGNDYWLQELKEERNRLSKILKNEGYYFFNPDFLLFHADTTIGQKQVDISLGLKDNIPAKVFDKYSINDVNIMVNSGRTILDNHKVYDSIFTENWSYFTTPGLFKFKRIKPAVSIEPGNYYTLTNHLNTLRYLQGMGAFRSVEVAFTETDSTQNLMDANIRLTLNKPIQTNLEMNFATKSNDFLGPAAIASVAQMNLFGGGEKLIFQIDGGFEWQKGSKRKEYELGFNSWEIGTQLKILFPRFLVPFSIRNQSKRYVPNTASSVGFRSLQRVKYYSMNLSQIKYGYTWRTTPKRSYKFDLVSIDYIRLTKTSTDFEDFLTQYPQVANSFSEQFIVGSNFSYTYSSKPKKNQFNQIYYNAMLDLSGNLLNAGYALTGQKKQGKPDPSELFGVPYSQFTKITNDFRYYMVFTEKKQIATRLLAGVGIPYGNSKVLPYVKQYFAGGSQDNRAFYARTIGPGSYQPADSISGSYFLDQSGEIKLMGNIEYRFPITYKTYGAVFLDAGNVWLIKEDPSRPGGKFEFNKFLNDIAIGSGIGLRVDITYFVIRLDAAIPIRKPYLSGSEKWIFDNSSFWGDYVFSLAIGYPF